jgi:hypothetical protein
VKALGSDFYVQLGVPVLRCVTHAVNFRASDPDIMAQVQANVSELALGEVLLSPDVVRVSPEGLVMLDALHMVADQLVQAPAFKTVADRWCERYLSKAVVWLRKVGVWFLSALNKSSGLSDADVAALKVVQAFAHQAVGVLRVRRVVAGLSARLWPPAPPCLRLIISCPAQPM